MNSLLMSNESNLEVIEVAKKGKKGYTNSGHLSAKAVSIEHRPTFADVSIRACYRLYVFVHVAFAV